ncbi:MAG: hypothetical protein KC613_14500 [Myxococcales bacterium]|nr:hypothetical protein [Myxococcales bacterium]MCB9525857.1 hypothetical protein [Myxococcales bacterium]
MSPSGWIQLALWPLAIGYAGWLVPHAWHELNDEVVVQGLFRKYWPPYPLPDGGHVIDPRPVDLAHELRVRFRPAGPERSAPSTADDVEAWRGHLAVLGVATRNTRARAPLTHPRLLWHAGQPRLVLGTLDRDYVALVPGHGVCLLPEVAPTDGPALDLDAPLVTRWTPVFRP